MNSPLADPASYVQSPADGAHQHGPRTMAPKGIVIHATGGTNSLAWLRSASQPPVSAHLLIAKSGTVNRIVGNMNVAYHAGVSRFGKYGGPGRPSVNDVTIGIELENLNTGADPYPNVQITQAARVCWRIYLQYGHLPIVSHQAIAPTRKIDPAGFNWAQFRSELRKFMLGLAV